MTYTKQEIRNIFEKAIAHKSYDKNNNFLGFRAYVDHNWQTITEEEKKENEKKLEQIKKEKLNSYKKGDFWLCAMGMEKEGDFNNHRARAEFLTPEGLRYFVEFTTYKRKDMDHEELYLEGLVNRTMEEEYNKKLRNLNEKNKDLFKRKRSEEDQKEWEKYFKQDYYWDRYHEGAEFLKGKPATRETALQMINTLFKTDFKELEIVEYLIEPDFLNN